MRLVYLTLAWVAGIIIAASFPALIPLFWLILLGITAFFALQMRSTSWRWLFFVSLAFALAGYRYQILPESSDIAQYNGIGGATIEGIVIAEPDIRDERILLRVEAQRIIYGSENRPTAGLVLVSIPRSMNIAYGDRLLLTGRMAHPAEYDTFSYADYLARQGVFSLMDNASVEILGHGEGVPFYQSLFSFKLHLQNIIAQALPEPQAALLTGILLGNERGIDRDLSTAFTRVGAAHIIAISGFNMSLLANIITKTFGILKREKLAAILGIIVLAFYTILVGANAAVVRAAIMSSLLLIAPLLKRKTYVPASLCFVALVLSLENPLIIWDISFQMSFFAVLGLALFSTPLQRSFERFLRLLFPRRIVPALNALLNEPIVASIAALSFTLPLTMLYFRQVSLVMFFVNILVLPIQSWILVLGGLALIIAFIFPALAQIFFWLEMLLLSWTIAVVRIFAALPHAEARITPDFYLIAAWNVLLIGGAIVNATKPLWAQKLSTVLRRRPVLNALLASAIGIMTLAFLIRSSRPDGFLHLWWLDVGHSNALLIQTPAGAQILVDGGHFPSRLLTAIGDRMPFYDRNIELIFITQPDEWDTSALSAVLQRYSASLIITNGQPNQSNAIQRLEELMVNSETYVVSAGSEILLSDGTKLEVLHPQAAPGLSDNLNDYPLVLRLSYGEHSFLLLSDISQTGQLILLDSGQNLTSSLMQLPQHGAVRSLNEEFVQAVQPQLLVLQADAANRRGEPNADTLAQLEPLPIFNTSELGTLHFWTDGGELWFVGTQKAD